MNRKPQRGKSKKFPRKYYRESYKKHTLREDFLGNFLGKWSIFERKLASHGFPRLMHSIHSMILLQYKYIPTLQVHSVHESPTGDH